MTTSCCPTCGQPLIPRPVRTCYDCGRVIGRGHKWSLQHREGIATTVHKSCEHPKSYFSLAHSKKHRLPPYNGVGESVEECEAYARELYETHPDLRPEPGGGISG